jgi:hypothetical protein
LSIRMLSDAMSAIAEWRKSCYNQMPYTDFAQICNDLQLAVFAFRPATSYHLFKYFAEQSNRIDPKLLTFVCGVCFVNVASKLKEDHSPVRKAETILMLIESRAGHTYSNKYLTVDKCLRNENKTNNLSPMADTGDMRCVNKCKYFQYARVLMHTSRICYNNDVHLSRLLTELSKIYLHSALECTSMECHEFHSTSHYLLSVYLACLYYSTRIRKCACDQSWLRVAKSRQRYDKHCHLQMQLLPCFHEPLETTQGFVLFYDFLRQPFRRRQHEELQADVCTTDLLAFYLESFRSHVRCSELTCRSRREIYCEYQTRLQKRRQLSIADVLLFHEVFRKFNGIGQRNVPLSSFSHQCESGSGVGRSHTAKFKTERLSQLLIQSAIEQLTVFRLAMSHDFNSVCQMVTSDFQAMYAHRYRLFEECFRLCETSVAYLSHCNTPPVDVFPETKSDILYLMDDDYSSLIGLSLLCGRSSTRRLESVNQLTVSLYLLIQSKLQLSHSPATFIEVLRNVFAACLRHSILSIINRGMLMFTYRKAVRRLLLNSV